MQALAELFKWPCLCKLPLAVGIEKHLAGANERWRHERFTNETFMVECLRRGKPICPLLSIPGVTIHIFRDDWLHAVDLGIGEDFIGNLFVLLMRKFGGTKAEQAAALWGHILKYYDTHKVQDRLKGFDWKNVQSKPHDPPKLRGCNAATARALIPFANEVG